MKISDLIKIEEFKVPGSDLVVNFREEIAWYDFVKSLKIDDEDDRGIFIMCQLIDSWNLVDEKNNKLPVTEDILKRIPGKIGAILTAKANKIIDVQMQKKKISQKN
jgi:hypothetical protein